jgi:hypoxanthine phosphoribosyltransferase
MIDPSYVKEILIPEDRLQQRIGELGAQISRDYEGQDLLLLAVLKGSVLFLSDLMRSITVPHAVDFMATSSYGASTESSGIVRILKDLDEPIQGRNVLIVEDIIDTGHTLDYLLRLLRARMPKSLRICTLLNKPDRREVDVHVDYIGFDIPNEFVLGYGLDYDELYRNLPYIAVLAPHVYTAE